MTVQVTKKTDDIGGGVQNMIDAMIEDYNIWSRNDNMKNRFASNFTVNKGKKLHKFSGRDVISLSYKSKQVRLLKLKIPLGKLVKLLIPKFSLNKIDEIHEKLNKNN